MRSGGNVPKTPAGTRAKLLDALRAQGPVTRSELARITSLSRSAISLHVNELKAEGVLIETKHSKADPLRPVGRPSSSVSLSDSRGYVVGVDFGRLHLRVGVSDASYRMIASDESQFSVDRPASEALDEAARRVDAMIHSAKIDRHQVLAVGIGVPGPVDKRTSMLHAGSILASWVGADVAGGLRQRLSLPVYMDNDANLGALAESTFGAGVGAEVLLYVLLSVGVGLGIAIEGKIFRGAIGIAGELGHVVTDDMGPLCRCGNRGCLEAKISVNALRDEMRGGHGPISVQQFLKLAVDGNEGAQRIIADAGTLVGRLVGDLCNYFNPDVILVGGELSAVGDIVLNPLRDSLRRHAIARARENVPVQRGSLGDLAELYGAVIFAFQKSLYAPKSERRVQMIAVGADNLAGGR
jgi:predicted NBD/HSP70 family sugar kinase/biotin operon repressor